MLALSPIPGEDAARCPAKCTTLRVVEEGSCRHEWALSRGVHSAGAHHHPRAPTIRRGRPAEEHEGLLVGLVGLLDGFCTYLFAHIPLLEPPLGEKLLGAIDKHYAIDPTSMRSLMSADVRRVLPSPESKVLSAG